MRSFLNDQERVSKDVEFGFSSCRVHKVHKVFDSV